MNFQELLKASWWFGLRPGPVQSNIGEGILIGLPALCVVLAVVAGVIYAQQGKAPMVKKISGSLIRFGLTMGILGFLLVFFRTQEIPFLAMRIWWVLWVVGLIAWKIVLLRRSLAIPGQLEVRKKRQDEFLKYLPH